METICLPYIVSFLNENDLKICAAVCWKWNEIVLKKEVDDIHFCLNEDHSSFDYTKIEFELLLHTFQRNTRKEKQSSLINSSRALVLNIISDFKNKGEIDEALSLCEIIHKLFEERQEHFDSFAEICGDLKISKGEYLQASLYYHKANSKGERKLALPECLHLYHLLMDDNRSSCIDTSFKFSVKEKNPSFAKLDQLLKLNHELVLPIAHILYDAGYKQEAEKITKTKLQYPLESLSEQLKTELENLVQKNLFGEFSSLQSKMVNFLKLVLDSVIPGFKDLKPSFLSILNSPTIAKYLKMVGKENLRDVFFGEVKKISKSKKVTSSNQELETRIVSLAKYKNTLRAIREEFSTQMKQQNKGNNYDWIIPLQKTLTEKYKDLIKRIIADSINTLPPADCKFIIIGLTSLSRKEMTPYSDIELAFIVREKNDSSIKYCYELYDLLKLRLAVFGETEIHEKFLCGELSDGFQIDRGVDIRNSIELIRTPSELAAFLKRTQEDTTMIQTFSQFRYLGGNEKTLLKEEIEQAVIPSSVIQVLLKQDCEEFSMAPPTALSELNIKKIHSFLVHTVSNIYSHYNFKRGKGCKSTSEKLNQLLSTNLFSAEFTITLKECHEFLTFLRLFNYTKHSKKADIINVKDLKYEYFCQLQSYHFGALLPLHKFARLLAGNSPEIQPQMNPLVQVFEDYNKRIIPLSNLELIIQLLSDTEEEKTTIRYAEEALKIDLTDNTTDLLQLQYVNLQGSIDGYTHISPLLSKEATSVNFQDFQTLSSLLSGVLQKQTCVRHGDDLPNMLFYIFNPELVTACKALIQQLARNRISSETSAAKSEDLSILIYTNCFKMITAEPMRDFFLHELREQEDRYPAILNRIKDIPLLDGSRISVMLEEKEWQAMINKISDRDELMESIYYASMLLERRKSIDENGEIQKLLNSLDYPHVLWHRLCAIPNMLEPLHLKFQEISRTIDKFIFKLKDLFKKSREHGRILFYLFVIKRFYEYKHQSLLQDKKPLSLLENEERTKPIHGMTIGFRLLRTNFSEIVFNQSGNFVKTNKYGKRKVTEAGDCFFKQNPEYPSVEYAAGKLTRLLVGVISPRTELVALKNTKTRQVTYYLMSKKVEGETLQDSWVSQPDKKLENQTITNYSKLVIGSLFTNPQDDIPPNFIITPSKIDYNENNNVSFMCIDNDHSFIDPIGTSSMGKQMISSNSIIFCQPHMKQEINKEDRENFLTISPEAIFEKWLTSIKKHNEFWAVLDKSLEVKLRKGVVEVFYNNFLSIRNILSNNKIVTHLNLLELVHRRVGKVYLAQLSKDQTPEERLKKISGHAVTTSLVITKSHPQQLAEVKTIPKESFENYITIDQALTKLKSAHSNFTKNEFGIAQANLLQGKPEQFKQASQPVQENIVNTLSFPSLNENIQNVILTAMEGIPFKTRLTLRDCKPLTNEKLAKILSHCPDLSELILRGCNAFSDISTIKNNCQTISKLDLSGTSVKVVHLSKLEHLTVLKLSGCKQLEFSKLELPTSLKHLDLSNIDLSSISSFKFKIPKLEILNLSNTKFNFKAFPSTKATFVDISKNEAHFSAFSQLLLKLEASSIYLNCSQCNINDDDVIALISSFSNFANLIISRMKKNLSIDLSNNPITSKGFIFLMQFLATTDLVSLVNLRDIQCELKEGSQERQMLDGLPAHNPNVIVHTSLPEAARDENEVRMQHHLICGIHLARNGKLEECQVQFQKAANFLKIVNKESQQKSIEEISNLIISVAAYQASQASYDTTLLLLQAAEKITPNNPDVYAAQVEVYIKQNKIREANENSKRVNERFPNFARGYLVASDLYVSQKQHDEAISVLTAAITNWTARLQEIRQETPPNIENDERVTKELLGLLLKRSEVFSEIKPELAIADVTTMIQLNPPIAVKQQLILLRAKYHHQVGDNEAASFDIADAISKQSLVTTFTYMSLKHIKEKQYEKAAKCLRMVIDKSNEGGIPVSAQIYGLLADCLYHSNKPQEAVIYYKKQIEEDDTESQQNLGCLYRVLNKFEEANECLKQSTTLDNSASPYAEYALFLYMEALKYNRMVIMSEEIISNCDSAINHCEVGGLVYNQLDKQFLLSSMQEELNESEFLDMLPALLAYQIKILTLLSFDRKEEVLELIPEYESKVLAQDFSIHYKMLSEIFTQMDMPEKAEELKQKYHGKKSIVVQKKQELSAANDFISLILSNLILPKESETTTKEEQN